MSDSTPQDSPLAVASRQRVCPSCGTRYDSTARFCPVDRAALQIEGAPTDDPLIASLVADRFYIERKLGEGGMGRVYLASQLPMNRACALKVMRTDALNLPDARARFTREALSVSRMSHANIVSVYDSGETADGVPYIAMEFIDGESLSATLSREGRLPAPRAALILMQVAAALHAAHTNGIVHRDLKPENILLGKSPSGDDHVKVVDFGIARPVKEDSTQLTSTGVVLGTPAYMSPEQLTGDRVDARSDVFSLALVTCAMLTGRLPFPTAHTELSARLLKPPTPLAELAPGEAWPVTVQDLVNAALAPNPADRPRTTLEFARNLVDALSTWRPDDFSGLSITLDALGPEVAGAVPSSIRTGKRTPTPTTPITRVTTTPQRLAPRLVGTGAVVLVAVAGWLALRPRTDTALPGTPADSSATAPRVPGVDSTRGKDSPSTRIKKTTSGGRDDGQGREVAATPTAPSSATTTAVTPADTVAHEPTIAVTPPTDSAPPTRTEPVPPPLPTEGWLAIGSRSAPLFYVNGELRGALTSLRFLKFPTGQVVTLRLHTEGCQDWDTTVTIRRDTTRVGFKGPRC